MNLSPTAKLCKVAGKVTPSRFWLKRKPNVKFASDFHLNLEGLTLPTSLEIFKTAWQRQAFQVQVEVMTKCEAAQTAWKSHSLQALVEVTAKSQAFQTTWKGHSLQVLVEPIAKRQAFHIARKGHAFQALVKAIAKRQALQTTWEGYPLQGLVECMTKRQALQTVWKSHALQVLVEGITKRQSLKAFWRLCRYGTLYACDPVQRKRVISAGLFLNEGPCSAMQHANFLGRRCMSVLLPPQYLALARSFRAPTAKSHDGEKTLYQALMEASPRPSVALHGPEWPQGASYVSTLPR